MTTELFDNRTARNGDEASLAKFPFPSTVSDPVGSLFVQFISHPSQSIVISILNPGSGAGKIGRGVEEAVLIVEPPAGTDTFARDLMPELRRFQASVAQASSITAPLALIEQIAKGNDLAVSCFYPKKHLSGGRPVYESLNELPFKGAGGTLEDLSIPTAVETRDRLTGLRTGRVLESVEALGDLNRRIKGEKVLLFLDVNHMGVANAFGETKRIDAFLSELGTAAHRVFGNKIGFELFRLGGDEFALILEARPATSEQALAAFALSLRKLRAKYFRLAGSPRVRRAEKFARMRAEARALRHEYNEHCKGKGLPFSRAGYRRWLRRQSTLGAMRRPATTGDLAVRIAAARLRRRGALGIQLMGVSISPPIRLGRFPNPEKIHLALGSAQYLLNGIKDSGRPAGWKISDPLPHVQERAAERFARDRISKFETEGVLGIHPAHMRELGNIGAVRSRFLLSIKRKELLGRAVLDPALSQQVSRYNLMLDKQAGDFLEIPPNGRLSALRIDITRFGVLNHASYARADELYNRMADSVSRELPPGFMVRVNGGSLLYLSSVPVSGADQRRLQRRLNMLLRYEIDDERSEVEAEEREALEAWARASFGRHSPWEASKGKFKTVSISRSEVKVEPSHNFKDILDALVRKSLTL